MVAVTKTVVWTKTNKNTVALAKVKTCGIPRGDFVGPCAVKINCEVL